MDRPALSSAFASPEPGASSPLFTPGRLLGVVLAHALVGFLLLRPPLEHPGGAVPRALTVRMLPAETPKPPPPSPPPRPPAAKPPEQPEPPPEPPPPTPTPVPVPTPVPQPAPPLVAAASPPANATISTAPAPLAAVPLPSETSEPTGPDPSATETPEDAPTATPVSAEPPPPAPIAADSAFPALVLPSVSATDTPGPGPEAEYGIGYYMPPQPSYPPLARQRGEEGTVILTVEVAPSGEPTKVSVSTSSGSPTLDAAAIEEVKKARFIPRRRGNTPIAGVVDVPVRYSLADINDA